MSSKPVIKVLYFASLREMIGVSEASLEIAESISASTVWKQLNPQISLPDSCLVAINQTYGSLDSMIKPGDEVAFFPPVTGG